MSAVGEKANEIRFCWADKHGALVCEQTGVFRVNCVDCLDRTNVVQTAFALATLERQLVKLGLVSPLANDEMAALPVALVSAVQHLWADNGDSISKQARTFTLIFPRLILSLIVLVRRHCGVERRLDEKRSTRTDRYDARWI